MNYDAIRTLLTTQLQTVTALPDLQTENTRYVIPSSQTPWCRATLITAEPNPLTFGPNGMNQHQGVLQIDLFYPQDYGTSDANAMASAVTLALHRGYLATDGTNNVQIVSSYQSTAYQDASWYVVPVMVRWSSYALSQ